MNRWIGFLLVLGLLAGCTDVSMPASSTLTPGEPATPAVSPGPVPDPKIAARTYLEGWKKSDFQTMYGLLTSLSQDAVSASDLVAFYQNTSSKMGLIQVDYEILSSLTEAPSAQVAYQVKLQSRLLGEIRRDTVMNLTLEAGQWRIQWDEALLLPELSGGNTLWMEYLSPGRGNIYDREGRALVAQGEAVSLGLIAGRTDPDQEDLMLSEIWKLTGLRPSTVRNLLAASREGWYVPLAEVSADQVEARYETLSKFEGLVMGQFQARYYFDGGVAPQLIGYVSAIQPEEVDYYTQLGYQQDERVGRMGLEKWAETDLAGQHGGKLYVVSPAGKIITKLAETDPAPAHSLFTTLDKGLQLQAQASLQGFLGAVVVLERDTGRVLAMASAPGFDPNLFEPTNYNSEFLLEDLLTNPDTPLLNRATQGQYPLGSVFKIVTMAAALESGEYFPSTTYYCAYTFKEIPGVTRFDWTYSFGAPASGLLTLPEGLMRSCNPFFWHIGLDLYTNDLEPSIADMARGFGLGGPTGINVVEEIGQVPVPQNPAEAINLAIGQGATLVTPLQVAKFVAAVGNGGNLLRPQVIEKIESPDGELTFEFSPEVLGKLPVSKENLAVIQKAMVSVVENPRGTAYWQFINFPIPIAGKTGTAEAPPGNPHAWFVGYTFAEQPGKPDIAIVVILEHAGEGSVVAAPVFKQIIETYFYGSPISPLPWETSLQTPPPSTDSGN